MSEGEDEEKVDRRGEGGEEKKGGENRREERVKE